VPVQKTGFFGVKLGFPQGGVEAGFPLKYSKLPAVRALSLSWIEHLTTNCLGLRVYPNGIPAFPAGQTLLQVDRKSQFVTGRETRTQTRRKWVLSCIRRSGTLRDW
jgi:hypothetical protein